MFKQILFASDLSNTPETVFEQMLDLAVRMQAHVTLFHAYDLQRLSHVDLLEPEFSNTLAQLGINIEAKANQFLTPYKHLLDQAGLSSEIVVMAGHPGASMIKLAEQRHCDLIVMGSRGLGPVSSLLLSSQSTFVLHHSPIPVLVLPQLNETGESVQPKPLAALNSTSGQ